MKTIYLNMRTSYGVETVDEFTKEPAQTSREFGKYVREMVLNYHQLGMAVYQSCRCTKDWRAK